jgi:hypothetical protein
MYKYVYTGYDSVKGRNTKEGFASKSKIDPSLVRGLGLVDEDDMGGGDRNIGTNRSLFEIGDRISNILAISLFVFGVGIGPSGTVSVIFDANGCLQTGHPNSKSSCREPLPESDHFFKHLK